MRGGWEGKRRGIGVGGGGGEGRGASFGARENTSSTLQSRERSTMRSRRSGERDSRAGAGALLGLSAFFQRWVLPPSPHCVLPTLGAHKNRRNNFKCTNLPTSRRPTQTPSPALPLQPHRRAPLRFSHLLVGPGGRHQRQALPPLPPGRRRSQAPPQAHAHRTPPRPGRPGPCGAQAVGTSRFHALCTPAETRPLYAQTQM